MRKTISILVLLLFLSCKERQLSNESTYTFQLPQKEIFVKTSKFKGGRFVIFFALDSLSLNKSRDSIEFRTGSYVQMIVDTTDIYINSHNGQSMAQSMGYANFNFKVVSNDVFRNTFFENDIQKYPYSFISIDTREYSIGVNLQRIKQGNIHGGW